MSSESVKKDNNSVVGLIKSTINIFFMLHQFFNDLTVRMDWMEVLPCPITKKHIQWTT